MQTAPTPDIPQLVADNGLFVVSHSGGKDSQALLDEVRRQVPASQVVVVYAALPGVSWEGCEAHARQHAERQGVPFYVVQARKTFLEMTEATGYFPTPQFRQCTSDLKRGPIQSLIIKLSKERGQPLVIDCQGLRAQESVKRAAIKPWAYSRRLSRAGRTVWSWLPIHDWTIDQVFASGGSSVEDWQRRVALYKAGRVDEALDGWNFHWAYAAGMTRLSCCFCIMASLPDLARAAELQPQKLADIVATEKKIGHNFKAPKKGQEGKTLDVVIAEYNASQCTKPAQPTTQATTTAPASDAPVAASVTVATPRKASATRVAPGIAGRNESAATPSPTSFTTSASGLLSADAASPGVTCLAGNPGPSP